MHWTWDGISLLEHLSLFDYNPHFVSLEKTLAIQMEQGKINASQAIDAQYFCVRLINLINRLGFALEFQGKGTY